MILTPGRLLFEEIVPPHLRDGDNDAPLDAGRIKAILQNVAEKEPTSYRDISHKLLKLGARASTEVSASFGLDDLESPIDKATIVAGVRKQEALINANPKLSPAQKIHERVKLYGKLSNDLPEQVFSAAMGRGSNLAKMVASGARGSKGQLNSNIGADFLMLDANSNPIPVPITHSYAEGLSPGEYFASAYGTRRGLLSTKLSVAESGYLCLAKGTMVRMADWSVRPIEMIHRGDLVLGSDINGNTFSVAVTNTFQNGPKETCRYKFRYGKSRKQFEYLEATPDHKVLAKIKGGLNRKSSIFVPTKLPLSRVQNNFRLVPAGRCLDEGGKREPLAFLIGYLLGDGGLTGCSVNFSTADQAILDRLSSDLSVFGYRVKKVRNRDADYEYTIQEIAQSHLVQRGEHEPSGKRTWLIQRLIDLGMWSKYAQEKTIPDEVWTWDRWSIEELAAGLLSSDGGVDESNNTPVPVVAFGVTSFALSKGLHDLFRFRLGIFPSSIFQTNSVGKPPSKNSLSKNGSNFNIFGFSISDRLSVQRLFDTVRMVGDKRILFQRLMLNIHLAKRINGDFVYSYVSKENTGIQETFDIEVDHPDHLFVLANGMVVSNSKQLAAAAHDLVVTKHNCDTERGIPVRPDDMDSIGSVLARPTGGYQVGEIVTGKMLRDIRDKKVPSFVVRSPLTCSAHNGICAVCAGIREKNRFPRIMENVGLAAASSVGEPLSQGTLCLAEGTMVRMADGSERAIERIRSGEWVLGCNLKGETFPVLVLDRYDNGVRLVVKTILESAKELISTPHHKVLHHCINVPTNSLEVTIVADEAFVEAVVVEEDGYRLIPIVDVVAVGDMQTFDIEVDHPDHLFVLANGMVVSNSEKHSGGVASSSGKAVSAFRQIDSLVQVPDIFPNAAAIARNDGEVSRVEDAPQGGSYVHVGAERHYVPRGRDILVKRGDKLEAGDVLSAGIPNPAEIVQHKGIGEGRLYFVNALRKAMTDNKLPVDRRNLEILGRSLVNHVRVTDPEGYGGNLPDDIVEYDSIEHGLIPLKTKPVAADPTKSLGRYLAKPVMHYSIGTRITPSVARTMHESGESAIDTIEESPGFEPEMQRVADIPGFKSDFMAQMAGSNLKRRLQRNVYSGDAVSDIHSTSYIPGLAKGTEFGKPPKGVVGY